MALLKSLTPRASKDCCRAPITTRVSILSRCCRTTGRTSAVDTSPARYDAQSSTNLHTGQHFLFVCGPSSETHRLSSQDKLIGATSIFFFQSFTQAHIGNMIG